jgi:hypothetical protein
MPFIRFETGVKSGEKLQFLAKNQRDKNNKVFVDIVNRAANEDEWMSGNQRAFSHYLHSSQKELYAGKTFNNFYGSTFDL